MKDVAPFRALRRATWPSAPGSAGAAPAVVHPAGCLIMQGHIGDGLAWSQPAPVLANGAKGSPKRPALSWTRFGGPFGQA